jgi:hypothetical protein
MQQRGVGIGRAAAAALDEEKILQPVSLVATGGARTVGDARHRAIGITQSDTKSVGNRRGGRELERERETFADLEVDRGKVAPQRAAGVRHHEVERAVAHGQIARLRGDWGGGVLEPRRRRRQALREPLAIGEDVIEDRDARRLLRAQGGSRDERGAAKREGARGAGKHDWEGSGFSCGRCVRGKRCARNRGFARYRVPMRRPPQTRNLKWIPPVIQRSEESSRRLAPATRNAGRVGVLLGLIRAVARVFIFGTPRR